MYFKAKGNVGEVPTFVPVPAQLWRVLETLFGINVEADVGV